MKAIFLLVLVSFAFCEVADEPVQLESNPIDIIKCIVVKALPLQEDVVELINAIKERDLLKVLILVQGLFEDVKGIVGECLNPEGNLTMNYLKFIDCLQRVGATTAKVQKFISCVQTSDLWCISRIFPEIISEGSQAVESCKSSLY